MATLCTIQSTHYALGCVAGTKGHHTNCDRSAPSTKSSHNYATLPKSSEPHGAAFPANAHSPANTHSRRRRIHVAGTHAAKERTPPRNTRRPRTMLRAATNLARAGSRRSLHSGSDFLGLSVPASLGCRHGMDMSRAPGYEVAADDEPPLIGNRRLADFAARHSRLSAGQMAHADGYLWVGHVIYPTGPETEPAVSWEISYVEPDAEVEELAKALEEAIKPAVEAKRRYSGGQARRLREQREDSAARKGAKRAKKRPQRKVKNDIPCQDDDPADETPA